MPPLESSLFDYDLPVEAIAQHPAARRDESRLMVVDRATRTVTHRHFRDLPEYLRRNDVLIRNNAAVLPARLHARRPTGGAVECFLLRPDAEAGTWHCLLRPGKRLEPGSRFTGPDAAFEGTVLSKDDSGIARVSFQTPGDESMESVAGRLGDVPLPPYIERADSSHRAEDLDRYQTVYAERSRSVAVAAPTAGLHFTPALLEQISAAGVRSVDVTLHVGLGTFRPITTGTIEEHVIHREIYEIPSATLEAIARPGGRRIAVGTTSVRAVEDHLARDPIGSGPVIAEASIFIHPPFRFRGVDALITNFHQPRSTLLCLVSAFLAPGSTDGIAWIHELYREALAREYRFLSYGNAMLIV